METFNFGYMTMEGVDYQDNGTVVEFGSNYIATGRPTAPPRRTHRIILQGMRYITDSEGLLDVSTNAQFNIKALEAFYEAHERWDSFQLQSLAHGLIVCKFKESFKLPPALPGANGLIAPFTLVLEEQR